MFVVISSEKPIGLGFQLQTFHGCKSLLNFSAGWKCFSRFQEILQKEFYQDSAVQCIQKIAVFSTDLSTYLSDYFYISFTLHFNWMLSGFLFGPYNKYTKGRHKFCECAIVLQNEAHNDWGGKRNRIFVANQKTIFQMTDDSPDPDQWRNTYIFIVLHRVQRSLGAVQ